MRIPTGCAAIGFLAWLVAAVVACGSGGDSATGERRTLRVARRGGQSGMEGTCSRRPAPRPFSADDVRALIEGTRTTTLAYRALRGSAASAFDDAAGLPMAVEVELQGEARGFERYGEDCNFRIVQDVKVTLSFEGPALDIVIETTVSAFSSTFAVLQVELGRDIAAALGLPPRDITTFSLAFDESGIHGTFEPHDECGSAVFPASVRCPVWAELDIDLERQRPGLRAQVVSTIDELGDIPLEWSDGTQTTLAVSLVEAPGWACGFALEDFCPEALTLPVSIRAQTADGGLDAELQAELTVEVATEASAMEASATEPVCGLARARTPGELEALLVSAYYADASGGPGAAVTPPLPANTGFSLRVERAFESSAPATASIRIHPVEQRDPGLTPPLDATSDLAGASCVVFSAREVGEMESL